MTSRIKNPMSIRLNKRDIPIQRCMRKQHELKFYTKNPRIFSMVWDKDEPPTQREIEATLGAMDHVKDLVSSIKANGGLLDPLLVRAGGDEVLEGNSRLAAFRLLARHDPIEWGEVKCDVLPEDVSDEDIIALLTQYHIVGRKDWAPFEQAGLFWRRWKEEGVDRNLIVQEATGLGLSAKRIAHMIEVYDFMVENKDGSSSRWSYYDEYLKSQAIQKARKSDKRLDKVIVKKVRSGEIRRAVDMRDKVTKIFKAHKKTQTEFIEKNKNLDDCYERACAQGAKNIWYQRLKKFRNFIQPPEISKDIKAMPNHQRDKCLFELKRIQRRSNDLIKQIEKKK